MSDREPTRLIDDEAEGEGLRVDLTRASEHRVDYDVAAGVAAFEASLAGAPPPGVEASVASGTTGVTGGKLMLVVLGLAAAVGVGAVVLGGEDDEVAPVFARQEAPAKRPDSRPAVVPEPPGAQPEVAAPEVVEPDVAPVEVEEPAPVDVAEPEVAPAVTKKNNPAPRRPSKAKTPKSDEPVPAVDRLEAEMAATNKARQALATNPRKALDLARKADRTFSGGLFAEQRAGIATLALFALGKDAEAAKAAERYLRKYPKGTYADKVRSRRDE